MRLERCGGPPDLRAAFETLVVRDLKGRSPDENHSSEAKEGQFPDFACFLDIVFASSLGSALLCVRIFRRSPTIWTNPHLSHIC